jgi:pimeloyl-ACP methyl ester carboxylesterase
VNTGNAFDGWDLHESGPADAEHTALLLPGGMCTGVFYDDLMAEPKMAEAPVRLVAATLPGFGNTPHPNDLSMENYAGITGRLASDLGSDIVVGHSFGANVAIEMAAAGEFAGPVVLLSPSFSREDEFKSLALVDRIGAVPGIGAVAWAAMIKIMPYAMKSSLPAARRDALLSELKKNDPGLCRQLVRHYMRYLDRHGSLVPRLCASGVQSWVVRGDRDEVGLTDEERRGLESCPHVTMVTVPDATHMVMTDQPARVAAILLEVIAASHSGSSA